MIKKKVGKYVIINKQIDKLAQPHTFGIERGKKCVFVIVIPVGRSVR